MKVNNFWLLKKKEKQIVKIVEWAQKNNKKVELLTPKEIYLAFKAEK